MKKKKILFYGFESNEYLKDLWAKIENNDSFDAKNLSNFLLDYKNILGIYKKEQFVETLAPSIHSAEFHRYFLSIQRRKKNIELHECYCEWQIIFSYFCDYLYKNSFDRVIFVNCPHEGVDLALWFAADNLNIHKAFFWQVPLFYGLIESDSINGKFLFSSSLLEHNLICKDRDFKSLKTKVGLNKDYRNLSLSFVSSKKKKSFILYEFIRTLKFYLFIRKYNFKLLIRHLYAVITLKSTVINHFLYLYNFVSNVSIKEEKDLDKFKPYIYFPLHQQPEMSTAILGAEFTEISDAIVLLSKNAKLRGINVLIKENPRQTHFQRGKNFFSRILKSNNVKLVSTSISSDSLIHNSVGVATITGTAAVESIFSGKIPLVFGNPWFRNCGAVFHFKKEEDLDNYFKLIENNPNNTGLENLNNFLFDLSSNLCDGVIDPNHLYKTHKSNYSIPLNEAYESILKCIKIRF